MPAYKLFYFTARARAEIIRLVFAETDVEYEDIRIEYSQRMEEKPKAPFGVFPYISIDGELLGQSIACAKYIAAQHKPELLGGGDLESARVNEVTDVWKDVHDLCIAVHFAQNDEVKEKNKKKIVPLIKALADKLESSSSGYFVGEKMTLADLEGFAVMETLSNNSVKTSEDLPELLKAHYERIAASPRIKAWLEKRPVTQF